MQLWLLEKELEIKKLLDQKNLDLLRNEVQADYILIPLVRTVKGSTVLGYKLHSAIDGSLIKQGKVLSDEIPEAPKVSSKSPREQKVQSSFAPKTDALIKFVARQELPFEVVDFDVGDINGDRIANLDDFAMLASDWLGHKGTDGDYLAGDVNRDFDADISDLLILMEKWLEQE